MRLPPRRTRQARCSVEERAGEGTRMFDTVTGREEQGSRRLGAGAVVSVVLHAAVLGAALVGPALVPQKVQEPEPGVVLFFDALRPAGPPPKGQPDAVPRAQPQNQARRQRPARTLTPPRVMPPPLPDAPPAPPEPPDAADTETEADAVAKAVRAVGSVGPVGVPWGSGTAPGGLGGGTDTLAFGPGMTRPVRLGGQDPAYTREALVAGVEGTLVVKCVVTLAGTLEDCRVLKGLPYMDEAVLAALATQRYRPATFQGHPVQVSYLFNVRLKLPR